MQKTNEKKENLLLGVYHEISNIKISITQPLFFDYIVPKPLLSLTDNAAKGRYIRDNNKMPKKVKEYYRDENHKRTLKNFLQEWTSYIGSDYPKIICALIKFFKELGHTDFASALDAQQEISRVDIFYIIFRYCFTLEFDFESNCNTPSLQEALSEFNKKVLNEYGVSGQSGQNIILQLANMGTTNPYILFEAAEIEYMNGYNGIGNIQEHLEKAYEYYKKASTFGFALADWSLGYLANMSRKKFWDIKAYANKTENDKAKIAIYYYKKAAKTGLAKAFNSLGSIVSDDTLPNELLKELDSAEKYYQKAAIGGSYLGMYHYARILEKKLKNQVDNKSYDNAQVRKQMSEFGKEMLSFFKDSANLGYPKSNYRCALYYGHLSDENTAMDENFYIIEENKIAAIKYLQKAVASSECFYDAYIYLSKYILTEPASSFYSWRGGCKEAKEYIKILNEDLIKTGTASERQRKYINDLKYLIIKKET